MNNIELVINIVTTRKLGPIIIYEFGNALDEYHPGYCVVYQNQLYMLVDIDVETLKDAVVSIEKNGKNVLRPVRARYHGRSENIIDGGYHE